MSSFFNFISQAVDGKMHFDVGREIFGEKELGQSELCFENLVEFRPPPNGFQQLFSDPFLCLREGYQKNKQDNFCAAQHGVRKVIKIFCRYI